MCLHETGLLYMLHHKFFDDAFTMHDETANDKGRQVILKVLYGKHGHGNEISSNNSTATLFPMEDVKVTDDDTRQDLDRTWARMCRFQPLWKIRNYFGEKIALYFAWCGTLILSLWIPMILGLAVFSYGLYLR